jgi:phosphosulfolactate synthase
MTNTLDKGSSNGHLRDELELVSEFVDLAKLGWGTSVVTPCLHEKIDVYKRNGVDVCFGGTLFELCHLRGAIDEYIAWTRDHGITVVEISDGTLGIEHDVKLRCIEQFAKEFRVLSEVGSKDATVVVSPAKWVRAIKAELDAGAEHVILEGRETGSAGLYRQSGEIRMGLIEEIMDSGIAPEQLIFEAPQKSQQVWLIETLGSEVNLANIPMGDVLALETLRLGLRSDTLLTIHGPGN